MCRESELDEIISKIKKEIGLVPYSKLIIKDPVEEILDKIREEIGVETITTSIPVYITCDPDTGEIDLSGLSLSFKTDYFL